MRIHIALQSARLLQRIESHESGFDLTLRSWTPGRWKGLRPVGGRFGV